MPNHNIPLDEEASQVQDAESLLDVGRLAQAAFQDAPRGVPSEEWLERSVYEGSLVEFALPVDVSPQEAFAALPDWTSLVLEAHSSVETVRSAAAVRAADWRVLDTLAVQMEVDVQSLDTAVGRKG